MCDAHLAVKYAETYLKGIVMKRRIKHLLYAFFVCYLCVTTMSPVTVRAENKNNLINKARDYRIIFNENELDIKSTPLVIYKNKYMIPVMDSLCEQGPKIEAEYGDNEHIKLVYENKRLTFFIGDNNYYSDAVKKDFSCLPFYGRYEEKGKDYLFMPLLDICSGLGLECEIDTKEKIVKIRGEKVTFKGKKIYTKYAYSLKDYAKKQYKAVKKVSLKQYIKYLKTDEDTTHNFKYLRVDRYRETDKQKFEEYFQYLIEDYCRQAGIEPKKSVLYGKTGYMLKVAKKYNLDPVFFANQTFLESAYGTTELALGNKIKRVALKSFKKNKKGRFITKKIKKKVKVYNLYGIRAHDLDPIVGGTSYAYYEGWTSVNKAIEGAAKYLKENYIGKTASQNTIFKMRYTYTKSIWHQYATGPEYAESIGQRMYLMSSVYSDEAEFLYDIPRF